MKKLRYARKALLPAPSGVNGPLAQLFMIVLYGYVAYCLSVICRIVGLDSLLWQMLACLAGVLLVSITVTAAQSYAVFGCCLLLSPVILITAQSYAILAWGEWWGVILIGAGLVLSWVLGIRMTGNFADRPGSPIVDSFYRLAGISAGVQIMYRYALALTDPDPGKRNMNIARLALFLPLVTALAWGISKLLTP